MYLALRLVSLLHLLHFWRYQVLKTDDHLVPREGVFKVFNIRKRLVYLELLTWLSLCHVLSTPLRPQKIYYHLWNE